jgi:GAF domain-containing protein
MPLVVQDQVVGVLDIHTARLGGVAEEDVSLLRSLANNLAGVIRRGRLFTELDTALTETRAAQARYLAQTWQKKKLDTESRQQLYLRSGTGLDDAGQARLNRVKMVALQLTAPALMPPIKSDSDQTVADGQPVRPSIVAPVILHDHAIGHLQLHPTTDGRPWSKEDLAMIEVVVSQLAQAAENLRLFDEAQNRAMFERRAAEISSRLRQAPTLESLARTAVEEISTTLEASHGLVKIGLSEVGRWSSPD